MKVFVLFSFLLIFSFKLDFSLFSKDNFLINDANHYFKEKQYHKAIEKYSLALEDNPNLEIPNFNLGNAFFESGLFNKAREYYEKIAHRGSKDSIKSKALYNTANLYFKEENYPKAIEFYKEALQLNPKDQEAKFNLELSLKKQEQQENSQQQKQQPNQKDMNSQDSNPNQDQNSPKDPSDAQNKQKQPEDNSQDNQQKQANNPPNQMSKEEALQILKNVQQQDTLHQLYDEEVGNYDTSKPW